MTYEVDAGIVNFWLFVLIISCLHFAVVINKSDSQKKKKKMSVARWMQRLCNWKTKEPWPSGLWLWIWLFHLIISYFPSKSDKSKKNLILFFSSFPVFFL